MRVCLVASAFIEGPPCHVSSAAQPREPRWSPSGVVASVHVGNTLGGPSVMADERPRFAPEILIERMGMADLGRNRRPTTCTEGTKGAVAFGPKGPALSRRQGLTPITPATEPWSTIL